MGDIVDLHGRSNPLENDELVCDLARFADGTLSEAAVKSRHRLTDAEWTSLGSDDALVRAIEAEKLRRLRSGQTKRERAAIEVADAPPILGGIMRDQNANERHRIDSIKTLDALASNGAEAAAAGARFVITINLGTDVEGKPVIEHYDKSIAVDPNDGKPTGQSVVAAIAAKKPTDDDDDDQGYF